MGMQTVRLILFHEAVAGGNKDANLARFNGFSVLNEQIVTIMESGFHAVIEAANAAGYHDIFRKTLLPITEMEKLMGKQGFAEILGGLIVKPAGKPTLVPASDKRPAITNAKIDFNEIQED